jgi:hypothetical protein
MPPQGCPPFSHAPAVQVPETPVPVQALPAPTQTRTVPPPSAAVGTQQPPPLQVFPPQQGWPDAPHVNEPLPPLPPPPAPPLPPLLFDLPPQEKHAKQAKVIMTSSPTVARAMPRDAHLLSVARPNKKSSDGVFMS